MTKQDLLQRAQELDIQVPEGATNKEIEALIKETSKNAKVDFDAILAEKDAVIENLNAQLVAFTKAKTNKVKATYKDYNFVVDSFRFKGEKHLAVNAVKNNALMEQLIEAKFIGLIKQ